MFAPGDIALFYNIQRLTEAPQTPEDRFTAALGPAIEHFLNIVPVKRIPRERLLFSQNRLELKFFILLLHLFLLKCFI